MKKTTIIILLLLPILAAAQKSYTIAGSIAGLSEPAKAYLSYGQGDKAFQDSTEIRKGKFQFKGSVAEPVQAFLTVKRGEPGASENARDYVSFYIENTKISIAAADSIKHATIKGSVADRDNRELEAAIRPLTDTILRIMKAYEGQQRSETSLRAGDTVRRLVVAIKDIRLKFVERNPNSFVALSTYNLHVLDKNFDPETMEPLFYQFSDDLKSSPLGQQTFEKMESVKRNQSGAQATDFTQEDLEGNPFQLSSLRGKYVLVDFWASWCAPCRAENPHLVKAYQELKDKNFEIVGVSLDQHRESWLGAIETDGLPWIHISDLQGWKNAVATLYGINSVPQNLLIDPQGVIVAKNLRGDDLTKKLKELIK